MRHYIATVIVALIIIAGCSSPSIRNTEESISRDMLNQQIGLISIDFQSPDETYYNFIIQKTREGIIENNTKSLEEKNRLVAYLQEFSFSENRFFLFRIRHTKPVHRVKDGTKFSFVNAAGSSIIAKKLETTVKWSGNGTMYEQCFIFKTIKPVTAQNFSKDESPLTFSAQFMGSQKMVYTITPN